MDRRTLHQTIKQRWEKMIGKKHLKSVHFIVNYWGGKFCMEISFAFYIPCGILNRDVIQSLEIPILI